MSITARRITPVLFVPDVEPCLKFWERIGFQRAFEVPAEGGLAFAAAQKDGTQVMYQSYESARKDPSASEATRRLLNSPAFLYVEVNSVDEVLGAMAGDRLEVEKHATFYGATEFTVRDPAGHFITFAEFAQAG